jgi:hypothetical protein
MTTLGPTILADAHVHFHRRFDPDAFLTAAEGNFRRASSVLGLDAPALGLVVLTAGTGDWSLCHLRSANAGVVTSEWSLERTAEEQSLLARRGDQVRLALVAGRQLQTAEALEVLALGCDADLPEGLPIDETLKAIRASGALPVVPWGLGKWWGRRGRLLNGLLETEVPGGFFLGDNGGRPDALPRSSLFDKARRLGIRDLPGSDPFPFAREVARTGSRGFVIRRALERAIPAASFLAVLRDPGFCPESYGAGEKILPFLGKQLGIQLHKHRSGRSS